VRVGDVGVREKEQAVVVGEAPPGRDIDASINERRKEFLRIADARECKHPAAAERGEEACVRLQMRREHRDVAPAGLRGDIGRAERISNHDQRMGACKLRAQRRPQGTGRDHPAVADAAPGVDDDHGCVLGERGILEAVIHDDHAAAGNDGGRGALDPRARHDGRGDAGQEQRLVPDLARAVALRIDPPPRLR